MKTLEEIKNNYAQEQGYEDWDNYVLKHFALSKFSMLATISVFEQRMDEICIRAQKAALENASENADTEVYNGGEIIGIDHKSITDPENLIQ